MNRRFPHAENRSERYASPSSPTRSMMCFGRFAALGAQRSISRQISSTEASARAVTAGVPHRADLLPQNHDLIFVAQRIESVDAVPWGPGDVTVAGPEFIGARERTRPESTLRLDSPQLASRPMEERFLTAYEVADLLRLNQQTVRNMIDRGELAAVRVGARRVRIANPIWTGFLRRA